MASITSSTGLASGIDYSKIIDSLMQIEQQPVTVLQTRIDSINTQKAAYTDLSGKLTSLKADGTTLRRSQTWTAADAASSNESIATATASTGARPGSYQMVVAQLATTQQSVSTGYSGSSAKVKAGTLTFETGGGSLSHTTDLEDLNGGAGVSRGSFKITDASGNSAIIDTSSCVSLDDVISKINTSLDVSVNASVQGDKLVLTDDSGGAGTLKIKDLANGTTAKNLGIVGSATAGVLTGTDVNYISNATTLASLNDGRGVATTSTGKDFRVTISDGSTFDVSLTDARNVGDVVNAINTASGGKVVASVPTGGNGISLADQTGSGSISVAALNGSTAAADLGLAKTGTGGTLAGSDVVSGLNTVLISSLNGGKGFSLGTISIQNRAGASANVDLSSATTVADVIKTINAAGINVTASLNDAGNGIALTDKSGGTGSLTVGDVSGTTAADFGLTGAVAADTVQGKNLDLQWVSGSTPLTKLNGGHGIGQGQFTITNGAGHVATIDLTENDTTLQNVIDKINAAHLDVTASVNSTGDGLQLTDSSGGAAQMVVKDLTGSAAEDLMIDKTATAGVIDGAQRKDVSILATDTLDDVVSKINNADAGVVASLVDDGSGTNSTRLSLTAKNSGLAGQVSINSGTTGLGITTLVNAQDASVFYGGNTSGKTLMVHSSSNTLTNVISNVSVDLVSASSNPVTVTVTQNIDGVVKAMNDLVTNYNATADQITTYTAWDSDTETGGVLMGDSTTLEIQSKMSTIINSVNKTSGTYKTMMSVGFSIDDNGDMAFDEDKFRAAYAKDPDSVQKLFTEVESSVGSDGKKTVQTPGLGYVIENTINQLTDPIQGSIAEENHTLDSRVSQFNDRISELNDLLAKKKTRLQTQFANLESVLSDLQSQQTALGSLSSASASSK